MDELRQKRKQANEELLKILTDLVHATDGHLRFNQILEGYGFVRRRLTSEGSEFYTEPMDVLERVKEEKKRIDEC